MDQKNVLAMFGMRVHNTIFDLPLCQGNVVCYHPALGHLNAIDRETRRLLGEHKGYLAIALNLRIGPNFQSITLSTLNN